MQIFLKEVEDLVASQQVFRSIKTHLLHALSFVAACSKWLFPDVFFLLIVLSFFPILAINLSLHGIAREKAIVLADKESEEIAGELDAVTSAATAKAFVESLGSTFFARTDGVEDLAPETFLESLCKKYDLDNAIFVRFHQDAEHTNYSASRQVFNAGTPPGKTQLVKAFEYLIMLSTDSPVEPGKEKIFKGSLTSILGKRVTCNDAAKQLRGVTFPIVFRQESWLFVWNYVTDDSGERHGYFFLVKNNDLLRVSAIKKAAYDHQQKLSGFIRLFSAPSSDILLPEAEENNPFKKWRANFSNKREDYLETLKTGLPWGTSLGNSRLYCRQVADTDWAAIKLHSSNDSASYKRILFVINLFWSILPVLAIVFRVLYGHWPRLSLKQKLITTLVLAIILPTLLMSFTFVRYQQACSRSFEQDLQQKLRLSNEEFDHGHRALEADYQSTFAQVVSSRATLDGHQNWRNSPASFANLLKAQFVSNKKSLPINAIALYDPTGFRYLASFGDKDVLSTQRFYDFYYSTMVSICRKMLGASFPDKILPAAQIPGSLAAYKVIFEMLVGLKLDLEQEKRLGETQWFYAKNDAIGIIMGVIHGNQSCSGIIVFFSLSSARTAIFDRIREKLNQEYPAITSHVYERSPVGMTALATSDNSAEKDRITRLINDSSAGNGSLSVEKDGFMYLMQPSKKFVQISFLSYTSTNAMHKALNRNLHTFLLFLVASLIILTFSGYSLYQRFMQPILETARRMDKLSQGDLQTRLLFTRNDEFGELKNEVDEIQNGLIQRKKLTAILSDHLVEMLENVEKCENFGQPASFAGIALVSDIRQFTTISETQTPDQITSMLNTHFAAMATAITSHGGKIYKFIGDAIEAIFETNADCSFEQAAKNAVNASFAMLRQVTIINQRRSELNLFTYKTGIGLASGSYVAGLIGDKRKRQDLTIIGSALENANKLEAMSKLNPALPIVMEQKIADTLNKAIKLNNICTDAPDDVYTFNSSDDFQDNCQANFSPGKMIVRSEQFQHRLSSFSWTSSSYGKFLIFVTGALFALLPILSFQHVALQEMLTGLAAGQTAIENQTNSFVTLLKSKRAPVYFVEDLLTDFSREIHEDTYKDPQKLLRNLLFNKIQPEKLLISFSDTDARNALNLRTICRFGISDDQMAEFNQLQETLFRSASKVISLPPGQLYSTHQQEREPVQAVKAETMLEIDQLFLGRELAFKVFPYTTERGKKALFWCPLLKNTRLAGILFLTMPYSSVEQAALVGIIKNQKWPQTKLYVYDSDNRLLAESPDVSAPANSLIMNQFEKIEFGDSRLTIHFKSFVHVKHPPKGIVVFCIAGLLTFLWAWFLTTYRHRAFAATISRQFVLALAFISMIPASILFYYLHSFQQLEKANVNWRYTRKLSTELDSLERRPQLAYPIWLNRMRELVGSEDLVRAYQNTSNRDELAISEHLNRAIELESKPQPLPISIARAICIDKQGNSWISFSSRKGETNNLPVKSALAGYCKFLFEAVLGEATALTSGIGVQAQQEMTIDAMLQVVRAMFGAEVSADVAGSIRYPAMFAAVTEQTAILASPVSGSGKPELFAAVLSEVPGILPLLKAADSQNNLNTRCLVKPASCYGHGNLSVVSEKDKRVANLVHQTAFTRTSILSRQNIDGEEFIALTRFSSRVPQAIILAYAPLSGLIRDIELRTLFWLGILFSLTVLILLVMMIISSNITGPVEQMILALKLLREREFRAELSVDDNCEIGFLCRKFNEMARKIQQRELIKTFVSDQARSFVESDASEKLLEEPAQKNLVLIFIETSNHHERNENELNLLSHLQSSMQVLCEEIYKHGGDIDKVIGHKLLVCFHGKNHDAFVRVQKLLHALRSRTEVHGFTAGIHYGKATSCLLGIGQQRDYTLIGDAVNTTARIHAAAKESNYNILFSESAVELASSHSDFELRCALELKGKSGVFNLYSSAS